MIRGTTPIHTFTLPFEVNLLKEVRISYAQSGIVVLEKTKADCTLEGSIITVKLTQEETLKFDSGKNIEMQLKVLTTGGEVLSTRIRSVDVGRCLNEEVLE